MHTNTGRIDCEAENRDYTYLFEFKCDKSAGEALVQFDDKDYVVPTLPELSLIYRK